MIAVAYFSGAMLLIAFFVVAGALALWDGRRSR